MNDLITAFGPMLGLYLVPVIPLLWAAAAGLVDKATRRPEPAHRIRSNDEER